MKNKWIFKAYKSESDYENDKCYFEKEFIDFDKMKIFSGKHSVKEKKINPMYCIYYEKVL